MANSFDSKQWAAEGPGVALGILADLLGYHLRLAHAAVFRDFEESVGRLGISPGRVGVLAIVEANPGLARPHPFRRHGDRRPGPAGRAAHTPRRR